MDTQQVVGRRADLIIHDDIAAHFDARPPVQEPLIPRPPAPLIVPLHVGGIPGATVSPSLGQLSAREAYRTYAAVFLGGKGFRRFSSKTGQTKRGPGRVN